MEVRMNDILNSKRMTQKQAIDVLASYSIANEGTNTLYLGLIEAISAPAKQGEQSDLFSLHDIEMLLNYFPHAIWKESSQQAMIENRETFYFPLIYKIDSNWKNMDNAQFLAIFQGLVLAGPTILKSDTVNNLLNSFVTRL
jgi:hypothetical protein